MKHLESVEFPDQSNEAQAVSSRRSGQQRASSVIGAQSPIAPLPERWIDWLHNDFHRPTHRMKASVASHCANFDELALARLFPPSDPRLFLSQLHDHAYCTAIASEVVAERVGLPAESAHVCGLLHDIGFVSALRHVDVFCTIEDMHDLLRVRSTLLRTSERHAIQLTLRWRLPSHLRFAIRDHTLYSTLTTPSLLASATVVAEHVAIQLGYTLGFDHRPGPPARDVNDALRHLGCSSDVLCTLLDPVQSRVQSQSGGRIGTRTHTYP